jgi:protein-S-isoprenylcysteine O-methyltransferase Ste14
MLSKFLIRIFNRSVTGSSRTRIVLTTVGPVFFLSLIILLVAASVYMDHKLGLPGFLPFFLRIPAAVILTGSGFTLVVWSVSRFFLSRGTPVPFNPPPSLVNDGPYAWSRNPMLTGVFLILFGIGTLLDSVSLTFILTPLFILVMIWELKTVEEPELVKRLGEDYVRYRERVPMFFPRIRRREGAETGKNNPVKDGM